MPDFDSDDAHMISPHATDEELEESLKPSPLKPQWAGVPVTLKARDRSTVPDEHDYIVWNPDNEMEFYTGPHLEHVIGMMVTLYPHLFGGVKIECEWMEGKIPKWLKEL